MTILTSVWSAQHPNAGRNIQQTEPIFIGFAHLNNEINVNSQQSVNKHRKHQNNMQAVSQSAEDFTGTGMSKNCIRKRWDKIKSGKTSTKTERQQLYKWYTAGDTHKS